MLQSEAGYINARPHLPDRGKPLATHDRTINCVKGMGGPCSGPTRDKLVRGRPDKEHAMSQKLNSAVAVTGIDIGKNSFHIVGHDQRGAIVLRQKWSRRQVEARLANLP